MADVDGSNAQTYDLPRSAEQQTADANYTAITDQARSALATNRTYANLTSPTAAQTTAQVKALSRQTNGVIRLLLNALEATD